MNDALHMQYNLLLGGAVTNGSPVFKLCPDFTEGQSVKTMAILVLDTHNGYVHAFECCV